MEKKRQAQFNMKRRPGDEQLFAAIDAWRKGKLDDRKYPMSQAEAIRRLCRQALRLEAGLALTPIRDPGFDGPVWPQSP